MGEIFNSVLFALAGFCEWAGMLKRHMAHSRRYGAVLAGTGLCYAVLVLFLNLYFFLSQEKEHALLSLMVLYLFFGICLVLYDLFGRKIPGKEKKEVHPVYRGLFFAFLLGILVVTIFSREAVTHDTSVFLDFPLRFLRLAPKSMTAALLHFLTNMALFLPLGYVTPPGIREGESYLSDAFLVGCTLSTAVELVQYMASAGQCDIDDILANTLGCLLGIVLYRVMEEGREAHDACADA